MNRGRSFYYLDYPPIVPPFALQGKENGIYYHWKFCIIYFCINAGKGRRHDQAADRGRRNAGADGIEGHGSVGKPGRHALRRSGGCGSGPSLNRRISAGYPADRSADARDGRHFAGMGGAAAPAGYFDRVYQRVYGYQLFAGSAASERGGLYLQANPNSGCKKDDRKSRGGYSKPPRVAGAAPPAGETCGAKPSAAD